MQVSLVLANFEGSEPGVDGSAEFETARARPFMEAQLETFLVKVDVHGEEMDALLADVMLKDFSLHGLSHEVRRGGGFVPCVTTWSPNACDGGDGERFGAARSCLVRARSLQFTRGAWVGECVPPRSWILIGNPVSISLTDEG